MTHDRAASERRRTVVVAGHRGDEELVRSYHDDPDADVRAAVLSALDRMRRLDDDLLVAAANDPSATVRRRAARLAARHPDVSMLPWLTDDDPTVVEVAAWTCGEHERVDEPTLELLIALAVDADEPLVRESAAAALGAIGDERGLPAIVHACSDKPNVRRRAVLALAPFEGDAVDAAVERALTDRDWQVRQAAEDLRRAAGIVDTGEH